MSMVAYVVQAAPEHSVDVLASIASALLGINLAVVALAPIALDAALSRRTEIEGARSGRRLRLYLRVTAVSTMFFGLATGASIVFLELEWASAYYTAYFACAVGVVLMILAAAGVLRMLLRDLERPGH